MGEEQRRRRQRRPSTVLPAFLNPSLSLLSNLTTTSTTQGKLSCQRAFVTPNYQIERLYIILVFNPNIKVLMLFSTLFFIHFSLQGFAATLSPDIPYCLLLISFLYPYLLPPLTWKHFHKFYS